MSDLDENGLRLLRLLVEKLPAVRPGDPTSYVGYKEVHTELGLNLEAETYGDSLRHQGLDSLAEWAFFDRLPAITGLIIDRSKLLPGQGFFRLYKKSEYDPDTAAPDEAAVGEQYVDPSSRNYGHSAEDKLTSNGTVQNSATNAACSTHTP